MAWYDDLASDERKPPPRDLDDVTLYEAVLATTPSDTTEQAMVIVPSFSSKHLYGPCPWAPRIVDSDTYATPSKGDRALVAISNEKEVWIVSWWPA